MKTPAAEEEMSLWSGWLKSDGRTSSRRVFGVWHNEGDRNSV